MVFLQRKGSTGKQTYFGDPNSVLAFRIFYIVNRVQEEVSVGKSTRK